MIRMGRYKNIDGKVYGRYQIIGDTGKRDKKNNAILIARHIDTGELYEGSGYLFRNGSITGYRESPKQKIFMKSIHTKHFGSIKNSQRVDNATGYKNVKFNNQNKRWEVDILFDGKRYRKNFKDFENAVIYSIDFKIKNYNPFILDTKKKFKNIKKEEIILNDYVKNKQKIIDEVIKNNKPKGVSWNKRQQKWVAYITINKKRKSLGSFTNKQDAINARQEAVEKYFNQKGDF